MKHTKLYLPTVVEIMKVSMQNLFYTIIVSSCPRTICLHIGHHNGVHCANIL